MRKTLFVTGTDTGVGKTAVAAGLIRWARNRGLKAVGVKPVETGCTLRSGMRWPADGAMLQEASEGDITLDDCCPFRFSMPAAPYRAAPMEGSRISVAELEEHVRTVAAEAEFTVVEGAGGLMVPIDEKHMMIDLIERLGVPVLLTGRTGLGTVNHTLLSLEALRSRGIIVLGIVLSPCSAVPGPEEEYTPQDITRLVEDIPVVTLPLFTREQLTDPGAIARAMHEQWPDDLLKQWVFQGEMVPPQTPSGGNPCPETF